MAEPQKVRSILVSVTEVSTSLEVQDRVRQFIEQRLVAYGYEYKPGTSPGPRDGVFEALRAWVRIGHRSIPVRARRVHWSKELDQRALDDSIRDDIRGIQKEFERGENLNPRLTRNFFKAGFNDFLYNHFKLQHVHLGEPNVDLDKTKKHAMCRGGPLVLIAFIENDDAYFVEVRGHDVFDDWSQVEDLLRIMLRNFKGALEPYVMRNVSDVRPKFEGAFEAAKTGFTCAFEVDGVVLSFGTTVFDSKSHNGSGTSGEVVDIINNNLNRISRLVEWITENSDTIAAKMKDVLGALPEKIDLTPVQIGKRIILTDTSRCLQVSEEECQVEWGTYKIVPNQEPTRD